MSRRDRTEAGKARGATAGVMRSAGRWAAAVVLACACFVAACNDSESGRDSSETGSTEQPPQSSMLGNIVTAQDLQQTPAGSPQRQMLEWFQAVQFQDVEGARLLTAPDVLRKTDRRRFERAVRTVGSGLGKPVIVNVRRSDEASTVRTLIQAFQPGRSKPVTSDPQSFTMVRVNGEWRLGELDYLLRSARAIEAAQ